MAEKIGAVKDHQKGSALMVTLLVLMLVCLTGAAVLTAAAVERKVVVSQNRVELLRQAADGGVQVARNIIMNYMAAGQAIPAMDDILLDNGLRVSISCDPSSIDNMIVTVTSRAYMEDADGKVTATKAVRAELLVACLPGCAVRASTLKLVGRYFSTVSEKGIDESGGQDWDVNDIEPRLAGDPDHPYNYPLQGPTYNSFKQKYQINHPYFSTDDQQWPSMPYNDHTWWVAYQYDSLDEQGFHDLAHSIIYIAPFYNPYGYLEVVDKEGRPERIELEQGWDNALTVDEQNDFFIEELSIPAWGLFMSEEFYQSQLVNALITSVGSVSIPDKEFKSQDFVKIAQVIENVPTPSLPTELLESYRLLSLGSTDWEYIPENSDKLGYNSDHYTVDIDRLEKTYIYIDCPAGETAVLDFNAALESSGCSMMEWLANNTAPFFNLVKNESRKIIIVSNADLELIMDNIIFEHLNSDTQFYVISPGNISLILVPANLEFPGCPRNISAFLWAGQDMNIHSAVRGCNYNGLINAGNNLNIYLENPEGILEDEPYLRIEKSDIVIQQFPEAWAYLGMAPIIAYQYID